MRVAAVWLAIAIAAAAASACGATPTPEDGGAVEQDAALDAGLDGGATEAPRVVSIEGPSHPFAGEEACFEATVRGEVGAVLWEFGDGASLEGGARVCHTFATVGRSTLGARSLDAGSPGGAPQALFVVSVVFRPAAQRPTSSAPIVVSGSRVYVVEPDANRLVILSGTERLASVPTGEGPRTVAALGPVVAVACERDSTLRLHDREGVLLETVELGAGAEPFGVIADPRSGNRFHVALRGTGELATVALDGALLARVAVGPEPRGLAMNDAGTLIATRWRSALDGARVYTLDARATPTLVDATVLAPETGLDSDTNNSGVLSFLDSAVPSPDGRRAVLPALKANVVTGIHRTGAPLTAQTTARAALGEVAFDGPDAAATDSFRHAFDDLGYASAAVFSPLGDLLYVAFSGAQTVVAVDAYDFFSRGSIDDVGEAPRGLAISADGERLYVWAFLSRAVRVYDVRSLASPPPLLAEISLIDEEPLAPEVLLGKQVFYRSRDPRMSRTRYLSCASCHLDGEGDALVWDFTQRGEGLRDTISLRGRAGVAPLHWSANFDEVQDFEHDIRDGQGGEGFLADDVFTSGDRDRPLGASKAGLSAELDALAAYVQSLTSHGDAPPADPAQVALGAATFASLGCDGCHSGPDYTDSALALGVPQLHDVGTLTEASGSRLGMSLTGLDTPTLRGLWRTAPYLHDGSAPTLRDVLTTRNPDGGHGDLSATSVAELDALIAFLSQLE